MEVRVESPAQSTRIRWSAQPKVQTGVQSCDSMHHQHQMQTRRKRPGIEGWGVGPRQRGIQNCQKGLPRDAADTVEVHGAASLTNQLACRVAAGGRRREQPRDKFTGFELFRIRALSFRGRNGFINHRPLDVKMAQPIGAPEPFDGSVRRW